MQMIGLARLGRDVELRRTQGGDAVCSLSLAFDYGRKGADGKKPTQWVDGALWGKQAESLVQYLVKGKLLCVTIDDPHIETFEGKNGPGYKLAGRISSLQFAGSAESEQKQVDHEPKAKPQPVAPDASSQDEDDDIPF